MRCPFRKETITIKTDSTESVKEIYCDCYEDECPFYVSAIDYGSHIEYTEICDRIAHEERKNK